MSEDREVLEIDVLFVGAGPACLAGAYHLARSVKEHDEKAKDDEKIGEVAIAVIEKGDPVGAHALSGAVMNPRGLKELIPDYEEKGAPIEAPVGKDSLVVMAGGFSFAAPFVPGPLQNHGNCVVSLNKLVIWLAAECEKLGVDIFPGFPAVQLLTKDGQVIGVRTGDKGIDKDGNRKPNFEPGVDIQAKVTVLGEGPLGTITKQLVAEYGLDEGCEPQAFATGVKEVWEVPEGRMEKGEVIHTMGYPLPTDVFGGGFVYKMSGDLVSIGFVIGLDYADPFLDIHETFQKFKAHPRIRKILEGGKMLHYGAKTIPEGGYWAVPKVHAPGALIVGDSAGLLDGQKLKGIHLGMKSGMLAADAIVTALKKDDFSDETLCAYGKALMGSWVMEEMKRSRNFRRPFQYGMLAGLVNAALGLVTRGEGLFGRIAGEPDYKGMKPLDETHGSHAHKTHIKFDGKVTIDKLTDVYHSGTNHEEDQPPHLLVPDRDLCATTCKEEFGNPCQFFCPAQVYEMEDANGGGVALKLNASNCVHCKTCEIKDPYRNITWVPPEGGGGPLYTNL